jgi:hypothetical protein
MAIVDTIKDAIVSKFDEIDLMRSLFSDRHLLQRDGSNEPAEVEGASEVGSGGLVRRVMIGIVTHLRDGCSAVEDVDVLATRNFHFSFVSEGTGKGD